MNIAAPNPSHPRVFASPLARRLAKEGGLDLSSLTGSGPHGRIIERDVKSALAGGPRKAAAEPISLSEAPSLETTRKYYAADSYEEVPHDSMRKAIARRLTESIQTVPHFYLDVDCEIDALLRLREEFNAAAPKRADGSPEWKTSVNDYIVKTLALALQRVPEANVTFTPEAMLKHKASDIGVAVAIPGGLITPIIRNAQAKTVREISDEVRELAGRARERKLKPQEYEGGVSAVSNLGMYGIKNFSAVINPPQSTILAVGKGEQRMVVKNGAPTVATIMSVTLSCDHRAVDGALGAELLAAFKTLIEQPMGLFA
ncbi:2-oxo acid dehydrogenase subunit E2 [Methylocystis sp. Sn-Cys]|uniref:2-oxo acid dehydrogenase subunit E2 n=1 Tax=Methylocystis sp. Sn-Cys TaxID=1701263 RepID=UPI0019210E4A|nr:2-oxo acid dehydrogenase subunit E2 [Methylocystis sp. Sn-Cys]MBL1256370.1 2-oxo acid dehydrogenase subunit E2 [Methylocystis sp. Sn-Cys]